MKCPNCNHENPEGNKFCAECGTKLKVDHLMIKCTYCHHEIPLDSKFCPDCGRILNKNATENIFTVKDIDFKMISVEGGSFYMGPTPEIYYDYCLNDDKVHEVTLDDYLIGEIPVTNALWNAVTNGYERKGSFPKVNVSINDCIYFLNKLNEITGMQFRLPTEAEWEYAARGGKKSQGTRFSGSKYIDEVAWYKGNSNSIHPVKGKKPNELGIYDMSGNILEWCRDKYKVYGISAMKNPGLLESKTDITNSFCVRGGHYFAEDYYCQTASRSLRSGYDSQCFIGFRLAMSNSFKKNNQNQNL